MSWGYVAVGVATLAAGAMSANASKKAGATQSDAAKVGTEEAQREFNLTRADSEAYRNLGGQTTAKLGQYLGTSGGVDQSDPRYQQIYNGLLADLNQQHVQRYGMSIFDSPDVGTRELQLSNLRQQANNEFVSQYGQQGQPQSPESGMLLKPFDENDLNNDPVYKASYESGLKMGRDAILKAAAARGGLGSPGDVPGGGILKDLTQFATDYTATKGNEAFNRNMATKQGIYGMLTGTGTTGLNATNATTGAGVSLTGQRNDLITSGANARAAGIVGNANAWNSSLGQAYNLYNNDRIYSMLLNRNGATPSFGYSGYDAGGGPAYG